MDVFYPAIVGDANGNLIVGINMSSNNNAKFPSGNYIGTYVTGRRPMMIRISFGRRLC